jgi:transposase-like protein
MRVWRSMKNERPRISSLSCQNPDYQDHQKISLNNLIVRKTYGQDQIWYLRCQTCGLEFSERKNTMLWNTKISEARAVQIADCLSDKNSLKGTVRITKVNKSTVKRLRREIGKQAKNVHNALVKNVKAKVVEFDERYGFAVSKDQESRSKAFFGLVGDDSLEFLEDFKGFTSQT